jgi:hypothetical protein
VAGSFFFFFGLPEANMATEGGRISPSGRWGGSRPPPVARSIFFFFFGSPEKSPEVAASVAEDGRRVAVGDGVCRRR